MSNGGNALFRRVSIVVKSACYLRPVRPSVHMYELRYHLTDFSEISYWVLTWKSVGNSKFCYELTKMSGTSILAWIDLNTSNVVPQNRLHIATSEARNTEGDIAASFDQLKPLMYHTSHALLQRRNGPPVIETPEVSAPTNRWPFYLVILFIFIVAPCILKIHLLSHQRMH